MVSLRQQFIDSLKVKYLAESAIENYLNALQGLTHHFKCSPLKLTHEQVKSYLIHLLHERKLSPATVNLHMDAMKTFFNLMAPGSAIMKGIDHVKYIRRLPLVLSREEVEKLIGVAANLKHRALLMLLYSSGVLAALLSFSRKKSFFTNQNVLFSFFISLYLRVSPFLYYLRQVVAQKISFQTPIELKDFLKP